MTPRISVIVPAYNRADTISECLDALSNQTVPRDAYEVIVVEDGSRDNTAAIARQMGVKVVQQPNRGPAAARNLGVNHARGEILLFTDADCVPARDWIECITAPLADSEIVGVKGGYRTQQRSLVARFVQLEYEEKYQLVRRHQYIDFVDTYSAAYRRTVFETHGGFDPAFPRASGEDVEFSYRLSRQGCKLVFAPDAVVYHRHVDSVIGYFRRKFHIGYWRVLMYRRHPQKILADSHTPQSLKVQVGLAPILASMGVLALFWPGIRWLVGIGIAVFVLTTVPFVRYAGHEDPTVAMVAPVLLFIRGLASGLGLIGGLINQLRVVRTSRGPPRYPVDRNRVH